MSTYLITYDLHQPGRFYDGLYRLLAGWNAVRITESNWVAVLKGPAPVIRDIVESTVHVKDTIAVIEIEKGADWATRFVPPAASTWLAANVTPAQEAA